MATKDVTSGITRNEVRLLHFIRTFKDEHLFMPTGTEMQKALSMSPANTARIIRRLKDRDLIDRVDGVLYLTAAGSGLRLPEKVG